MQSSSAWRIVAPLLLLAACTLVFWKGLGGGFILDDFNNIVVNKAIHAEQLDAESLLRAARAYGSEGTYGRPLATVSLALNYRLSEKDPYSYKLTNLAIHAANAWLVLLLVLRLTHWTALSKRSAVVASLLVATLWAVHPLQVSTVLYIVQRMEILATTFVLLALLAYLKGRSLQIAGKRGRNYLALSIFCMLIGMLSKETAVLFPAFALCLELTVLGFRASTPIVTRQLKASYLVLSAAAATVFVTYIVPAAMAPESFVIRDFTAWERVLTQARVLPLYLLHILAPLPSYLTFYYDNFAPSRSLLDPWTTLAGVVLIVGLLAAAWLTRRKIPLFSLGILWFFAGHSITSNLFNLELVFEHRNYFPLLGILLSVAALVICAMRRLSTELTATVAIVLVLGFGGISAIRSATWGDELLLATDLAGRNADSPRASSELATLYAGMSGADPDSPFFFLAISEFERASALPRSSPLPEQGLILLSATAGAPVRNEWWDRINHKLSTQPIGPQEILAVSGMLDQRYKGLALDDRRLAEVYETMLSQRDLEPHFSAQLGDFALTHLQDEDLADRMFANVVRLSLDDPEYIARVAGTLAADGHQRQAQVMLELVVQLGGDMDSGSSATPKRK